MNLKEKFLKEVEREADFLKANLEISEKLRIDLNKIQYNKKGSRIIRYTSIYTVATGSYLTDRTRDLIKKLNPLIRTNCGKSIRTIIDLPMDFTQLGFGSYSTSLEFFMTHFPKVNKELIEYIRGESAFFPALDMGGVDLFFKKNIN